MVRPFQTEESFLFNADFHNTGQLSNGNGVNINILLDTSASKSFMSKS